MIWPIRKGTLTAGSTERLDVLAHPKADFLKGDNINRWVKLAPCQIQNIKLTFQESNYTPRLKDTYYIVLFHS